MAGEPWLIHDEQRIWIHIMDTNFGTIFEVSAFLKYGLHLTSMGAQSLVTRLERDA